MPVAARDSINPIDSRITRAARHMHPILFSYFLSLFHSLDKLVNRERQYLSLDVLYSLNARSTRTYRDWLSAISSGGFNQVQCLLFNIERSDKFSWLRVGRKKKNVTRTQ